VENFGTMRKHEVIFHILQKMLNAPACCSRKGFWKCCRRIWVLAFPKVFNYLPCPEDIYVSPSQIRRFDLQTGNLIAARSVPPRKKSASSLCLKVERSIRKTR